MIFHNFLNGEFVAASDKNVLLKESPFTGEVLGEIPRSSAMDFIVALQGAKKAMAPMKALSLEKRREILLKMAEALESQKSDYAYLEALHQGLPAEFVLENSLKPSIQLLKVLADDLSATLSLPKPTGVISIICSWQLSLLLMLERVAPALAAGNVILVKASELSPISGVLLGQLVQGTDLPPGAVQILQGDSEIAQLMFSHPGVQAVSAVGSTATLEAIAKSGVSPFKKLQLSGSAKNRATVLTGFDFENNFSILMQSFLLGQGQLCWNSSGLMLLESAAEDFYFKIEQTLKDLKPLLDPSGSSFWTPVISKSVLTKAQEYKNLALQEKGVLLGSEIKTPAKGFFAAPTFVKDLTHCSVLHQDELQAPLFLVNTVKYQHEMAKWINNGYLGHSSSLWGDFEKAQKVASSLEVAHIGINIWRPGGKSIFGSKQSGFGNPDMSWNGSFYSDAKKLTMPGA